MIGRRILILVPHPDDEVVGAGAATMRARAEGADVFALYLTTGVPAPEILWPWQRPGHASWVRSRREEAEAAADLLGLEPLRFLDLPTRSLRLNLADAWAAILATIEDNGIDVLWTPAYEGGHQDHDSCNFLASRLRHRIPVWEFAEYNRALGQINLQRFPQLAGTEHEMVLAPIEVARKRRALSLYRSETRNLSYVKTERETFRPLPDHDYSQPPHPGLLFYQRFQWVPFRHPRVDFTRPEDVCAAFAQFGT